MSAAQKENRGQASLVSKLTWREVWRRFWLLVSIDILVIFLFLGAMIVRCETIAAEYDHSNSQEVFLADSFNVYLADGYTPRGIKFGFNIDNVPFFKSGIIRDLYIFQLSGHSISEFRSPLELLEYSIAVPVENAPSPQYWEFTFYLGEAAYIFQQCFYILLIVQAIGLFADIFDIRKSIRKSLRPIYDLTLVAQNMNATVNPIVKLPGQELHLSGAIDTLNNITEDDLGRRIVISDEREELRGLAEAINAMLDRLDAAYRSQLRFVSDASHELRTPISVIQGYANMLDRWGKNDTNTLQESIDAIKTEASGMQDLVEQLLFLARSDNRSIVLSVETINTFALADEVLRETQMIDPNHEFAARLTEGLCVRGDIQLLKQALRIFVDNAIKYTPNGGRITLSTASEDHLVKISVSDTGIGIPAGDLERVFDRFFRSDESRTRGTGGTGLGLSIAKWIIDRHGGFVEIVSREDFGTKVTIALPRYGDVAAAPAVNADTNEPEQI